MTPLYLYSQDFFYSQKIKSIFKKILGRGQRGPQGVLNSLIRGLQKNNTPYFLNQNLNTVIDVACVLSGTKTLEWAIEQKKLGKIKNLIAGPNVVVTPEELRLVA